MRNFKRILALVCVFVLLIGLMAGCKRDNNGESTTPSTDNTVSGGSSTTTSSYTINLKSAGGLPLADVTMFVYADEALTDLTAYGETDENGQAVITVNGGGYLVLSNLPAGYEAEASYPLTSATMDIVLSSHVIEDTSLSGVSYELGSVMHDFTMTASDGTSYTLSELLEEKDAVILNFWYTTCTYCVQEFPYLDAVYQQYSDNIEVLALDDYSGDTKDDVAYFKNSFYELYGSDDKTEGGLSFPMFYDELGVGNAFNLSGYPTTVVIDRYGVVCFVYAGGIPSDAYWGYIMEAFIGDDYTQTIYSSLDELIPAKKPTEAMASSDEVKSVLCSEDLDVTFTPEEGTDDAENSWPFLIGEKDGVACLYASNIEVESSYATMYANLHLEEGDVIAFDYYSSCEANADVLYVLVNRDDVYQISGLGKGWNTCYTWVAKEAGDVEVAFCYFKDSSDNEGDDTVYVSNFRVVGVDDIDKATYIPRECATNMSADGFGYENYVDVVFNETDGYYHVGTANGPLLLADLMMATQFSNDPVYSIAYDGKVVIDGVNYYDDIVNYCSYASNSQIYSLCPVNEELKDLLQKTTQAVGVEGTDNEWLQICKYYDAYGTGGVQLADPTAGLNAQSAYLAQLGSNSVYYDRVIMPRGLLNKFVPEKSGVYAITSHSETYCDGWIFTEESLNAREAFYEYWCNARGQTDPMNVYMMVYLEAGKEYFIDIAYYDTYATGTIDFTIEYVGAEYDNLVLASPGFFTYADDSYAIVSGGINVALGDDGYYHEKRADGSLGSILYLDVVSTSTIFNDDCILDLIRSGVFNFEITEDDQWIIDYYDYFESLDFNGTDFETCMEEVWGEDFDYYWELMEVENVLDGYYHGTGKDMTDEMAAYAAKAYSSGELDGCVPVDEDLAEILQQLMDKYTFDGVENSWIKLCYYYEHLGPDTK